MSRYKPIDRNPRLLPVVLSEQIQPGSFEFALDHPVDNELDLSALDARFRNDETDAVAPANAPPPGATGCGGTLAAWSPTCMATPVLTAT